MSKEETSEAKKKFPPCQVACPAHVNVQAYISLIQMGRFREAVEVIRMNMPFPAICGRICFAPCEKACARNNVDQAVAIRSLKRLAADIEREQGRVRGEPLPKKYSEKVAIIGSGPSGLSAAYDLIKIGYSVTVFERAEKPGGMMWRIPDSLIEKFVIANEIAYIQDLGVEIICNTEFGKDIDLSALRREYDAIFIALGKLSEKTPLPSELLDGDPRNPVIVVDPETGKTKIDGLFAGGDAIRKRLSGIIQAVGDGKRAAVSIHHYLSRFDSKVRREEVKEVTWCKDWSAIPKKPQRYIIKKGEPKPRIGFEEVAAVLEEIKQKARFEAFRCLACGSCEECLAKIGLCELERPIVDENLCIGCGICVSVCPFKAVSKSERGIPQVDAELCKGCGICVANCPMNAIRMENTTKDIIINRIFANFGSERSYES